MVEWLAGNRIQGTSTERTGVTTETPTKIINGSYTILKYTANGKFISVGFDITDSNEEFGVIIRNNIAEILKEIPKDADITVSVESSSWKGIILGIEDPKNAISSGKLSIAGNYLKFFQFATMFEKD